MPRPRQLSDSQKKRGRSAPKRRKSCSQHPNPTRSELPPDLTKLTRGEIITHYHNIKKQLALVDKSPHFPNEASREARRQILRAQLKLIGIEQYQNASREGEALGGGFDSSQWILSVLRKGDYGGLKGKKSLTLLDVGAIAHRFPDRVELKQEGRVQLEVTSIDLNPEDSEAGRRVIRADFFEFAKGLEDGVHDVICLSLCVNFEGSASRRGLMLLLAARILKEGGLVFLVLPRACVENSRYLDEDKLGRTMKGVGLEIVAMEYTTKLVKCVARREGQKIDMKNWKELGSREVVRGGDSRNNFAICLDLGVVKKFDGDREGDPAENVEESVPVPTKREGGTGERKRKRKGNKVASGIEKPANSTNRRKKARREKKRKGRLDVHSGMGMVAEN